MTHDSTPIQIEKAYRRMATDARYRPAAPSDGFGNISVPAKDLDLEEEAEAYAAKWIKEEDSAAFHVGVCNYTTRPATIFAIEAARSLCATADEGARDLLRMALAELDALLG